MAVWPIHSYFILNGEVVPCAGFSTDENEGGVYEVFRVSRGIFLFFNEHLQRLSCSAAMARIALRFSSTEVGAFLSQLIKVNGIKEGNVLLSCNGGLKAYFVPHKYPDKQQYKQGVKAGILHAGRENPNAKVFQAAVRRHADETIALRALYEVLLVNGQGYVTEGSRSNLFFMKDDMLVTPPMAQVLPGITRMKVLECAQDMGLAVEERKIKLGEIARFDSAFISGTSPTILPLQNIEEKKFDVNSGYLRKLMAAYDILVNKYLDEWEGKPTGGKDFRVP